LNLARADFRSTGKEWLLPESESDFIEFAVVQTYQNVMQVKNLKMNTWLEFLGYYLSEGVRGIYKGVHVTALSQNINCNYEKALKIDSCMQSLKAAGFKLYTTIGEDGTKRWHCWNKQLYFALKETGVQHATKCIPRWVLNTYSEPQLRILFDALMVGDGTRDSRPNRGNMTYYSTSRQLADDVQELALKLGYYAQILEQHDKRPCKTMECRSTIYRVQLSKPPETHVIHHKDRNGNIHIDRMSYEGKVYCFDIQNQLLVTRRNGKVTIQGSRDLF
jgi:hypothetical protein